MEEPVLAAVLVVVMMLQSVVAGFGAPQVVAQDLRYAVSLKPLALPSVAMEKHSIGFDQLDTD